MSETYEMLVAERKYLLTDFLDGSLKLPKPDAYAHDQLLVRARDKARHRIVEITKALNEMQPFMKSAVNVKIRSKGAANYVPYTVERAAYITGVPEEKIRAAAESHGTMMAGNYSVLWETV